MKGLPSDLIGAPFAHFVVDAEKFVVVFVIDSDGQSHECMVESHNCGLHNPIPAFGLTAEEGSDSQSADAGLGMVQFDAFAD